MNSSSCKACVTEFFDKWEQFVNLWFYMAHSGLVRLDLERDYDGATSLYKTLHNRKHRQHWLAMEARVWKLQGKRSQGWKAKSKTFVIIKGEYLEKYGHSISMDSLTKMLILLFIVAKSIICSLLV